MNLISAVLLVFTGLGLLAAGATRIGAWYIERSHPPSGDFASVNQTRMHYVHMPAKSGSELPAVVFIHGASGNLRDQLVPLAHRLDGKTELLFVDRPGHGWSGRGPDTNKTPAGQADTLAELMDHLEIGEAIVVGHSFGGAIAAALGVRHPQKAAGLLFLAPATHPWPGGDTSWYYRLTNMPMLGWLFSETLAWPGGSLRVKAATDCVFAPNKAPASYTNDAAIPLVLRPGNFRANAEDVEGLYDYVRENADAYKDVTAPTIVISGTRDTVVYEEIHSTGLGRDIPGAELIWVRNLGHKPDWVAGELVVAAIEKLADLPTDLAATLAELEARIAGDAFGPIDRCPDEKPDYSKEIVAKG